VRQQSREQRTADQPVQRSWSIEPALAVNGTTQIVYMRLGSRFEAHIPHGMAILLANGLTDAVETNVATTYSRRKGIHHNNTPGDK